MPAFVKQNFPKVDEIAFVKKVNPMTPEKISLFEDLKEAANEVKLHKQGRIKLKTAQELLDEL